MSFKNYNLETGNGITLQDSGFLLNYLADAPSDYFMEHILNIYAEHPSEGQESSYAQQVNGLREKAKNALKINLLFSALTGYN